MGSIAQTGGPGAHLNSLRLYFSRSFGGGESCPTWHGRTDISWHASCLCSPTLSARNSRSRVMLPSIIRVWWSSRPCGSLPTWDFYGSKCPHPPPCPVATLAGLMALGPTYLQSVAEIFLDCFRHQSQPAPHMGPSGPAPSFLHFPVTSFTSWCSARLHGMFGG